LWREIKHPEGRLVAVISGGYRSALPHHAILKDLEEEDCDVYCTGPQAAETRKPYVVENIGDQLASWYLEQNCFLDLEDTNCMRDDSTTSGDGNILIECYKDGTCKIHPELKRCTYTSKS